MELLKGRETVFNAFWTTRTRLKQIPGLNILNPKQMLKAGNNSEIY